MIPGVPMSTTLPASVRDSLVAASRVESRVDFGEECPERAASIDAVIALARNNHPQFFKKEK